MSQTRYVVLSERADEEGFEYFASGVQASSANAAIRKAVNENETANQEMIFVAVPQRSWNPKPVVFETQTKLRIG